MFGSLLAVFLMLMIPNMSAIEYHQISENRENFLISNFRAMVAEKNINIQNIISKNKDCVSITESTDPRHISWGSISGSHGWLFPRTNYYLHCKCYGLSENVRKVPSLGETIIFQVSVYLEAKGFNDHLEAEIWIYNYSDAGRNLAGHISKSTYNEWSGVFSIPVFCKPGEWITCNMIVRLEADGIGVDDTWWHLREHDACFKDYLMLEADPDLNCDGSLSWSDISPGATVTNSFTVSNIAGSNLSWKVAEYPDWGTWSFNPENGTSLKPEDGPVDVNVEVNVPNEKEAGFSGEVKIVNLDNPEDFEIVPVTLSTPKNKELENIIQNNPHIFPLLRNIFYKKVK